MLYFSQNLSRQPPLWLRLLTTLFIFSIPSIAQTHTQHTWFEDQSTPLRFDSWQGDREFKGRSIFSLTQGPQGYLWIGSDLGVFRFDGKTFTRLKFEFADNSAPLDFIWELSVINDHLWIGTNHGVIRYHMKQEQAELFSANRNNNANTEPGQLSASGIRKVLQDNTGQIWVATTDGLNLFEPQSETFRHFFNPHLDRANFIKTMAVYDEQHLLVGDIQGDIYLFNMKTGKFSPFYRSPYGVNIREIMIDAKRRLWIANKSENLDVMDLNSGEISTITLGVGASARKLAQAKNGMTAVITETQGLYIIDEELRIARQAKTDSRFNMALTSDDLSAVLIDKEQNLWLGGFTEGLFRLNAQASRIWHLLPQDVNQSIHGVLKSEDALFLGGTGWLEIRKPDAPFDLIQKLAVRGTVYAIKPALDKGYLLSTSDGLGQIQLNKNANGELTESAAVQWYDIPDGMDLFSTLNLAQHTFVASSNGLWFLTRGEKNLKRVDYAAINNADNINDKVIYFLLQASEHTLVFGGHSGVVYQLTLPEMDVTEVTSTEALEGIKTLILTAKLYNNELFLAADGVGLIRYSLDSHEHSLITDVQGLISKDVNAIEMMDQHSLWLSHNGGLSKFDLISNSVVSLLQEQNGLQGERFNYAASEQWSDGCVGFGGTNGFNYLCPEAMGFITPIARPVIQSIEINHRPLSYQQRLQKWQQDPLYSGQDVHLGYEDKHIGVNFSAIQLYPNPHLVYAYRLLGLSESWTDVKSGSQSANFTTLPAGKYQLEIKAYSELYPQNQAVSSLPLTVSPPWWSSPGAIVLYVIGIFLSGVGGVLIRVKQVRTHNQKLQQLVSEKTSELIRQNTQIQRIAQDNKNLLQQKDQLLSMISHEMKTPLTVMQGVTEGLLSPSLAEPQRQEIYQLLSSNIERLKQFVKHILMLAKIRQNKQVSFKTVPFSAMVRAMLQSVERLASERKQELRCYIPYEISLKGSCFELEIMVLNLVKNAIVHSGEHTVIAVSLNVIEENLLLEINDNGKGMDAERLNKLFQHFAASDNDMDISTGLGLALVKEIVTVHQGEIKVESSPGKGTSVRVTLPKASISEQVLHYESSADTESHNVTFQELANEETSQEQTARPVLLIADDEPDILRVLNMQLSDEYTLNFAADGDALLQFIEQSLPDVILLDYSMPGKNGLEVTALLRAKKETRLIPIVLFSASNDAELKREAMHKGVDIFVEKPFDYLWLKSVIDNAWYRRMQILNALMQSEHESSDTASPHNRTQPMTAQRDAGAGTTMAESENAFTKRLELVLKQHLRDPGFGSTELSEAMFMTQRTLQRKIKLLADTSPQIYLFRQRCELAKNLINKGDSVEMAADKAGFSGAPQMRRWFKKLYGETPSSI